MLFFLPSLDFDLGRSKQPFYEAKKGARMISLSHTHKHPFFLNLTPINLYGNHSNYSLNLGLHLVGTGLLNTVSLGFVPMNLAFKTFDLVCWIWGVLYRVYTKGMNDCLLGVSLIINWMLKTLVIGLIKEKKMKI